MKNQKLTQNCAFGGLMLILFVIYTIMVKFIDVDKIGAQNSEIGFSTINDFFRSKLEFSKLWYNISKVFGIIVILTACMFALLMLIQLIRRKSIYKVDKNYISLAVFYTAVAAVYLLFEKLVINYRPIIMDEGLEPSYPSTHTILAVCVMGSAVIQFRRLFRDPKQRKIANIIAITIGSVVVICRLLSGVHWVTDILGGLILSTGMLIVYNSVFIRIEKANRRRKRRIPSK